MSRHSIVTRETFAGFGGPLAIDSPRGLVKAFTGDTIITLSDGSRHVIAKELMEAIVPTQEQVPGHPTPGQQGVVDIPNAPDGPAGTTVVNEQGPPVDPARSTEGLDL